MGMDWALAYMSKEDQKRFRHFTEPTKTKRKDKKMHYRNGREAKNGDKVAQLDFNGQIVAFGVLHSATPGNDYCNGMIAPIQQPNTTACIVDCLHVDDIQKMLEEKELAKRPAGK